MRDFSAERQSRQPLTSPAVTPTATATSGASPAGERALAAAPNVVRQRATSAPPAAPPALLSHGPHGPLGHSARGAAFEALEATSASLIEQTTPHSALVGRDATGAHLYTLGAFRLLVHQGADNWIDLSDSRLWGHGRAQDLLLLLLLRRRPLARVEAAATLWPEADTTQRARRLRNALWNLRRALYQQTSLQSSDERGLMTQLVLDEAPHTLRLRLTITHNAHPAPDTAPSAPDYRASGGDQEAGSIWSDVEAFERAAQQARAAQTVDERLRLGGAALQLYAGPFLQHRRDASWITAHRERLQARWVQLALDIATDLRRAGRREAAIELLLSVLQHDPEQIEAAGRAMLLLSEVGRMREALDLYERTRRLYRALFGADPAELKRLATDLRAGSLHVRAGELMRGSGTRSNVVRRGRSETDD